MAHDEQMFQKGIIKRDQLLNLNISIFVNNYHILMPWMLAHLHKTSAACFLF